MMRAKSYNLGQNLFLVLRIIENNVFKTIGKTSVGLGTASMATASSGATAAIATIHSEVGTASKAATALLALLPQP